ncbi:MAG: PilZ domain-containing protein [Hyphomicrobiaceae bacterium]
MSIFWNNGELSVQGTTLDRAFPRLTCRLPAELKHAYGSDVIDLLNISNSGAMCETSPSSSILQRESVILRLLDDTELEAKVRWVSAEKFGLEFQCYLADAENFLIMDHMGGRFYSAIYKLQAKKRANRSLLTT